MLPHSDQGQGDLTFVLMHFLGGSHRTWFPTLPYLDRFHRCVALNTPGFGDAADISSGYDINAMVDQVDSTIRELGLRHCILVGHSMTGKVAVALASRTPDYLRALILVGPSPITPQPMTEHERQQQLQYGKTLSEAQAFVDQASAHRLPDPVRDVAIADAQLANLEAWRAWVAGGSREDWSQRLFPLEYPTLLVCGADDHQVPGPDEQKRTILTVLPNHQVKIIQGAGHLMPMQTPQVLTKIMLDFAEHIHSLK